MLVPSGTRELSGEGSLPRLAALLKLPPYDIAPHVRVCVTGDGSVLLDLKRDKYLGLGRRETECVAAAVDAWPRPTWDALDDGQIDEAGTRDLCRSLAEAGILSRARDGSARKCRAPVLNMRMEWISIGDEMEVRSKVTFAHAANCVIAYGLARSSLAWRPFATVVEVVQTRKNLRGREIEVSEVPRVAALVGIFRRLRPFVFAPEGRCLLHALTLINFLAHYDFYPRWVIGVATQPWGAHSWVQWENYLLDSNPEKVCRFTPILVV